MATIDIKLKSYDELIFEITTLNTYKYLLQQENKQLKSLLTELEEWLKEETKLCDDYLIGECHTDYTDVLNKIQELKEKY